MTAQARRLKQQLRSALIAAQWRGDTAFNTSIVLAEVHGLSGLFRAVSAVEPSLSRPLPPPPLHPVPVPNKQPRFCGRKAKWSQENITVLVNPVDCSAMRFGQRGLIAKWPSGSQRLTTDDVRKYSKPQRWPQGEGRKLVCLFLYISYTQGTVRVTSGRRWQQELRNEIENRQPPSKQNKQCIPRKNKHPPPTHTQTKPTTPQNKQKQTNKQKTQQQTNKKNTQKPKQQQNKQTNMYPNAPTPTPPQNSRNHTKPNRTTKRQKERKKGVIRMNGFQPISD